MVMRAKKDVLFVLTVDTEESWDWDQGFPQEQLCVDNINQLPTFQAHCDELGIKPTYFVDYPVVADSASACILKDLAKSAGCEIGAHLHPWCNPPLEGQNTEAESHVINLPIDLVERKLQNLLSLMKSELDVDALSFRTGRWGINAEVLNLLAQYGITTDSSIYPYYKNRFFSCYGAPNKPYWPDLEDPLREGKQRDIFELPISAGFNKANFEKCSSIHDKISGSWLSNFRLTGIAWQLNLLRKIYLSPELNSADDMISLIKQLLLQDQPVIHMFIHSSSLMQYNDYNNHAYQTQDIYEGIIQTVNYLKQNANVTFCTISQASERLNSREQ